MYFLLKKYRAIPAIAMFVYQRVTTCFFLVKYHPFEVELACWRLLQSDNSLLLRQEAVLDELVQQHPKLAKRLILMGRRRDVPDICTLDGWLKKKTVGGLKKKKTGWLCVCVLFFVFFWWGRGKELKNGACKMDGQLMKSLTLRMFLLPKLRSGCFRK